MKRRDCEQIEEAVNIFAINPYKIAVFEVKFVW
jgi:hypothetical protein